MAKSKKEKKMTDLTAFVIIIVLAGMAMLLAVWYFSYKVVTNPGIQQTAGQLAPLLLAA